MSMTDPIADLLARLRNAHIAQHATLDVPRSRIKARIVEILKEEGYIEAFDLVDNAHQGTIHIKLKYQKDGRPAISGMERVSRPGRRTYRGKAEIPRVLNGLGIAIVSTPKGVMTGSASRRAGLGGELLCNVW